MQRDLSKLCWSDETTGVNSGASTLQAEALPKVVLPRRNPKSVKGTPVIKSRKALWLRLLRESASPDTKDQATGVLKVW